MSFDEAAFFTLHRDLPREGPGEAGDVAWAASVAGIAATARIADVACGPGGDIAALLAAAPEGHIVALDKMAHFVQAARAEWRDDPRVTVLRADMSVIANAHDLIWCAGAVYFIGVTEALRGWRKALRPGGAIAFSEACWFTDTPGDAAREHWAREYPTMANETGVNAQIDAAGYEVLGQHRLSDVAWEAYLAPLDARIAMLRNGADAGLSAVLDEAEAEAALWRAHRQEFGYLLSVVRPR